MRLAIPVLAVVPVVVLFSAGCGRQPARPSSPSPSSSSSARLDRISRKLPTATRRAPGHADALLDYHGGPVLEHVDVWTVFWGNDVLHPDGVNAFYADVTNSPYLDWLVEYSTPTQAIGRGQRGGSIVDANPPAGDPSDDDIAAELDALVDAGRLPEPDANTLFMVHFPPGITVYLGPYPSCGYLGYHSAYLRSGRPVYYGVLPDCYSDFDTTTDVSGHELLEAVTDPDGTDAVAWNDDAYGSQGEIGDLCGGSRGTIDGYAVQLGWSNSVGDCVASVDGVPPQPGPAPPPNTIVKNGDFEAGLADWTATGVTFARYYQPHAGRYSARVGSLDPYAGDSSLSQTVTLPSGASTLNFYYQPHCPDTIAYDQLRAELRDAGGATLKSIFSVCADDDAWTPVTVDLSPWAGHAVQLWFGAHDDDWPGDPSFLVVDDVAVTTP
jgi:hypothetical protein